MNIPSGGWCDAWPKLNHNYDFERVRDWLNKWVESGIIIIDEYGDEFDSVDNAIKSAERWYNKDSQWYSYFPVLRINYDENMIMLCYERMG